MIIDLPEASSNPRPVFEALLRDLVSKCRDTDIPESLVEGIEIAMNLAYSLGEQAGRNKGWAE